MTASPWRARALFGWLILDPRPFWAAFLVPLLALWVTWWLPEEGELKVRVAGYSMTVVGVGLVAWGVRDTQKLFARPTYRTRILDWLKRARVIFGKGPIIVAMGAGAFGMASASARATVWSNPKNSSISERLRAVEENLTRVASRITTTENEIERQLRTLREEIGSRLTEHSSATAALSVRLEEFSAGNLDAELVGAVWVLLGQAYGSFPAEIARLFN